MRSLLAAVLLVFAAAPAAAQQRPAPGPAPAPSPAAGPTAIGRFQNWEAATFTEQGRRVCYAFTRAATSAPAVQGRSEVVLMVTHRPGSRDQVAVRAGYAYPQNAEPSGVVDAGGGNVTLAFFTSGDAAFARDREAAVAAFRRGRSLRLQGPGPRGGTVTDTFSLLGFSAAYQAITEACR